MTLRSVSLAAGLSLTAVFVLSLPLSAQAGAHCNCAGAAAHSAAFARASVHTAVAVHASASASAYSHAGGAAVVRTAYRPAYGGGYSRQDHYPMRPTYYPTHYPARYPAQGGYAYNNGHDFHHDYDRHDYDRHDYDHHRYDHRYGGNSYSLVYSPTYADSGYVGGYADYGDYAAPAPDYNYDNGYAYAQPYDEGYADTRYNTTTYDDMAYDDAAYAPPAPEPEYAPVPSCACSQPLLGDSAHAYGWRDAYGNWHVTSQSSRYSYSYSY
jgi:hypothetical protein